MLQHFKSWVAKGIQDCQKVDKLNHLQFCTGFFLDSLTGISRSFISGALRIKQPFLLVTEINTRRGSCRAVTMCPSSFITSQHLELKKKPDQNTVNIIENQLNLAESNSEDVQPSMTESKQFKLYSIWLFLNSVCITISSRSYAPENQWCFWNVKIQETDSNSTQP